MAKFTKQQTTIAVIAVLVTGVFGARYILGPDGFSADHKQTRSKGNAEASVKVVEFIDFQCPSCAMGARFLNEFMESNPGKIHLEMKYFPLNGHKHALLASNFAECSSYQGKFWEFHDLVLERQSQWRGLMSARPAFELIAQEVGLDLPKLTDCVADPKTEQTVLADKNEGRGLKVRSTPTYFVNGKMVVGPKFLKDELKQVLP